MTSLSITTAQRKLLKADAHELNPVVMIGNDGLSAAVLKEANLAISSHGLIKIRVFGDDREARLKIYAELCDKLNAAPIQQIGKLLVIWRPKIEPKDSQAHLARTSKQTKKTLQSPRSSNRATARTSASERSDRRSAAFKSAFPKKSTERSANKPSSTDEKTNPSRTKTRVTRADAAESKIGWSSPGYRKATAPATPIKRRKIRQSSTKKKLLG